MDKATLIKITQDLIQLDTVNDHEEAVSDYLTTLFTANGISTKKLTYAPGRTSLIAEIGDPTSKQVLVFSGHQDTVATGDAADWPYAGPFSGELHAGRIYGRGAADMKSGLAAMAATLIALKDAPLKGRLRFVATVGEEFGAHGARELTEQGYADNFSGLVIGEPTGQKLIYAHSGSIDYTVTSIGKAAHSSLPETGINAITNLVKFITAEAHAFDDVAPHPALGDFVHSVTVIKGGTQVNSIPGYAQLAGNMRPIPSFDNAQAIGRLQTIIDDLNQQPDVNLKLNVDFSFVPVLTAQNDPLVTALQASAQQVTGKELIEDVIHGATDASEFTKSAHKFPVIIFGPGDWSAAHQSNESVSVANIVNTQKIYQALALRQLS